MIGPARTDYIYELVVEDTILEEILMDYTPLGRAPELREEIDNSPTSRVPERRDAYYLPFGIHPPLI